MGKIKKISLKKSMVLYLVFFALLALLASTVTSTLCYHASQRIDNAYPDVREKYYLTNAQGEQLGEGTYVYKQPKMINERDARLLDILDILPVVAAPVYSVLAILAASVLFYRNKLKKPLAELRTASEKIADNDLDFSIGSNSKDELGQLCVSFELMRATLADSFSKMWRQVEERKALNAAFAHELRTPLTVLKGYNEILQASENVQIRETAATMGKHISRMENYVSSMSNMRRMEDTQPEYKDVPLKPFLDSLYESAKVLCAKNNRELILQSNVPVSQLSLDSVFISQVCNNLVSNAVRYARSAIILSVSLKDNGLLLSVADDGKGFDISSLQKATNPYFTEESSHSDHFGLGLYICRLLCENHNGYLKIENTADGAKVSAYFKSSDW